MFPVAMANLTKVVPETVALTYGGIGPCARRGKTGSGVPVLASLWGMLVTNIPRINACADLSLFYSNTRDNMKHAPHTGIYHHVAMHSISFLVLSLLVASVQAFLFRFPSPTPPSRTYVINTLSGSLYLHLHLLFHSCSSLVVLLSHAWLFLLHGPAYPLSCPSRSSARPHPHLITLGFAALLLRLPAPTLPPSFSPLSLPPCQN